jgi:cell division transport system permease protein
VLGLAILWAGLALLNQGVRDLAQAYDSSFQLAFLSAPESLAVVGLSALLGWTGALLSVSKYLR